MDTALPQKFPFILDRNLAKANGTGNRVCTTCDTVVLGRNVYIFKMLMMTIERVKTLNEYFDKLLLIKLMLNSSFNPLVSEFLFSSFFGT